ncbi:hypothetical protein [Methanobrevibacter thaueri]|uniref:DUF4367 domain-containing protein n=1 Tax=Methanobrevibacter thaueri TaxID=190975 RepID=A0A315XN86_9EURY|nr:hypothetical protein [Methanobrevibacter thaueri]PWB87796.1 hypothetical protein MBBTH_07650 [Methanobrevibacter thaueri]
MNKKIFAILSILAVLMIGCAYASDSTDSLNNNTITISGMNFTIPDGFTEDVEGAIVNETGSDEGYNYVTESKTFECNDDFIIISVSIYDKNLTVDYMQDFGDESTINNVTGYFEDVGFLSLFSYTQGNKLIIVSANEKQLIEDVVS